jgi:hypothetical protein
MTMRSQILERLILTSAVLGTMGAVVTTGRVTLALVVGTAVVWSFVPVLQLLTGLLLVRDAGARRAEALARYFATDRYWSTWALGFASVLLLAPEPGAIVLWLAVTALAPLALTARALVRLRCDLFGDRSGDACWRVAVHQAITVGLIAAYAIWAGALGPRITALGGP